MTDLVETAYLFLNGDGSGIGGRDLIAKMAEEIERLRSTSGAWDVVLKWLDDYSEEEATFSRYHDDVILDGIMTAAQRRALAALFPKAAREMASVAEEYQLDPIGDFLKSRR